MMSCEKLSRLVFANTKQSVGLLLDASEYTKTGPGVGETIDMMYPVLARDRCHVRADEDLAMPLDDAGRTPSAALLTRQIAATQVGTIDPLIYLCISGKLKLGVIS
ncbi:MAG: hypothetical protein FWD57_13430 [Polyangiaceae bacterium]|nr:hypothetical protein [Polyangiaceae bacterium]